MKFEYTLNTPTYRFTGQPPKVGIRPTIDGRQGGIREGLEEQTMNMARAAAQLITGSLKHPNGMAVECVLADTTIGGVAEAAACAEKFEREGVGVSLTVSPCWCYGSETMDMDGKTPKAVWGFNGTERPGAVYLAAVLAAHNMKGLPAFSIYGHDVQDAGQSDIPPDVSAKILTFVRAGLAMAWMRGRSYLSLGATCMGIAGSIIQPEFFEEYLGMRVEFVDQSEIIRRLELGIYDHEEYEQAYTWVKENFLFGLDPNEAGKQHDPARKEDVLQTNIKMTLILRDLFNGNPKLARMGFYEEAKGRNAIAAGFQGQRQWTDFMPNGDLPETVLNSSFDWTGIREPYVVATENDAMNGVTMLFGKLLTGTAQIFADVRTYWSPEAVKRVTGHTLGGDAAGGFIHLINSGSAAMDGAGRAADGGRNLIKPWYDMTSADAQNCLSAIRWCYGNLGYFRGGGYSCRYEGGTTGGLPLTMARMNYIKGVGPVLQLAEGVSIELPKAVHDAIDRRTDPTWPTTWFVPRITGEGAFGDVYSVMANWGANHGSLCYGHVGHLYIALASMLRIPVCMHNVPRERIVRPSAWSAFGTADPEGADYRACAAYGPVYGTSR